MRFTSVAVAAALTLVSISTSLAGQGAPVPIDARSMQLLAQAKAARAAGNFDVAADLLESAVAADPANRQAFVVLGEVSASRGLPGKAIRYYREALALDPNDVQALQGQGAALVQKGAVERAKQNLAKIRALCRGACPPATVLAATIVKGPPIATAQAVRPKAVSAAE